MNPVGSWQDDFMGPSGSPPDPSRWRFDLGGGGWGDEQLQHYTDSPSNAALTGDGRLAITARRKPDGTITSARLLTQDLVSVRYGRVTARIQVPGQLGTWAAFWMLGTDIEDVGWPACGEIDVMEHVGVDPHRVHGTAHLPGHSGVGGGLGRTHDTGVDLSDDFHDYSVAWAPSGIRWLLDGREFHRLSREDVDGPYPFDHDLFLLLNLAVGGNWPGHEEVEPELPATMLVDHVRIEPP